MAVSLRVQVVRGGGVGAVGVPGARSRPVQEPDGDDEDEADEDNSQHQAAAEDQQRPELILRQFRVNKTSR